MDLFASCPQLVVQDRQQTLYEGFLEVSGREFHIAIELPNGSLQQARISCDWRLKHLLAGYEHLLEQRLQQSTTLASFMQELKTIAERVGQDGETSPTTVASPHFYSHLLEELADVGWQRLSFIEANFRWLHLEAKDSSDRSHMLKIHLHEQHPEIAPDCVAELPLPFHYISTGNNSLKNLFSQFEQCLEQYKDFWDAMDEVDSSTWVLEPEKPTRSATVRRIALVNNASLQIEVNPIQPTVLPKCTFLGADHVTNPLKENLCKNLHEWSNNVSLLDNLQNVLEMTFPSPANTKKEDLSVECGICYAYRLAGCVPELTCDDPRCRQTFHCDCLYEWLRSDPTSRISFNMVFGECPYCSKPITMKAPNK